MRTNIEIDDELLSQAMTAAGQSTKRATVEEGLRLLIRVRKQTEALAELQGLVPLHRGFDWLLGAWT